jgi:hypothetical protein
VVVVVDGATVVVEPVVAVEAVEVEPVPREVVAVVPPSLVVVVAPAPGPLVPVEAEPGEVDRAVVPPATMVSRPWLDPVVVVPAACVSGGSVATVTARMAETARTTAIAARTDLGGLRIAIERLATRSV